MTYNSEAGNQSAMERTAALQCEKNFVEFRKVFSHLPGARLHEENGLVWLDAGLSHAKWSGVFRTILERDRAEDHIKEIRRYFNTRSLPFSWWTGPSSQPAQLGVVLQRNGFRLHEASPGMITDLTNLPEMNESASPQLSIKIVENDRELDAFVKIVMNGFGITRSLQSILTGMYSRLNKTSGQPFVHLLAYWDDKAVATASLLLTGDSAGLYNIVTLPEARGRGIGGFVTLHSMQYAAGLGYKEAVLRASQMGYGVYRRLGFRECCMLTQYIWESGE